MSNFKKWVLAGVVVAGSLGAAPASAINGQQLTFVPLVYNGDAGVQGDWAVFGADAASDTYKGDAMPDDRVPILCFKPTGADAPEAYTAKYGNDRYYRWAAGEVGVTGTKYRVKDIVSKAFADEMCAKQIKGSRMASFHEGWGWRFGAYVSQQSGHMGDVKKTRPLRAATFIRDQRANAWQQ